MSQMQQGQNWFEICLVSPGKMPDLERLPIGQLLSDTKKEKKPKTSQKNKTKQNQNQNKKKTKNKKQNKSKNKTKQSKTKQNPQCGNTSEENLMHCIWIK